MVDATNGPDKRLRELEVRVAEMKTASDERQKRIDMAFTQNEETHTRIFNQLEHFNEHLDRMERAQMRATFIIGIIVFLTTIGSSVVIKIWLERALGG